MTDAFPLVRIDYVGLTRRAAEFGFRRASYADLEAGMALAEKLTGQAMATAASIHWIDGLTGMAGWVICDPVDGVFITVALSAAGVEAGLHHSTVQARAEQYSTALGFDIRSPRGRVRLSLALALRRLATTRFD